MSYAAVGPDIYRVYQPDTPWHPGSEGWYTAPVPGWGENPNLLDRHQMAIQGLGCGGGCGCKGAGAVAEPSDLAKYALVAGLVGVVVVGTLALGGR